MKEDTAYALEPEMDAKLYIRIAYFQRVGDPYEKQPYQMFCLPRKHEQHSSASSPILNQNCEGCQCKMPCCVTWMV